MVVLTRKKQNQYQAFYTRCSHITGYMTGLLQCQAGMSILEPCAGDGAFIDEILRQNHTVKISAFEMDEESVSHLEEKYRAMNSVHIQHADFALLDSKPDYDRVIANPPYGAYQTAEKRAQLKKVYPEIYTKETYGLFLVKAMEMLKPGGRLVFIIPDTFLTLHMHEGLRKKLLSDYKIESIALFPSKFFPGVNFGYAGLAIIAISHEKAPEAWNFPIYKGLLCPEDLDALLTPRSKKFEAARLSYEALKANAACSFYLADESWVQQLLDQDIPPLESICHVVTGFYSGNDAHYLRRSELVSRGVKKYTTVDQNVICDKNHEANPPLAGIDGARHWVPIVKGGNKRFHKPSEWFMDWSKKAVHDYKVVNKKKARFQNSPFYFSQGIAVPMVSSGAITAALIDGRLFDQSIVGIFPREGQQHLLLYLLGFFNSKICSQLIRTINGSANHSCNYIKRIPVLVPEIKVINEVTTIVNQLCDLAKEKEIAESDMNQLNEIFEKIYSVPSVQSSRPGG